MSNVDALLDLGEDEPANLSSPLTDDFNTNDFDPISISSDKLSTTSKDAPKKTSDFDDFDPFSASAMSSTEIISSTEEAAPKTEKANFDDEFADLLGDFGGGGGSGDASQVVVENGHGDTEEFVNIGAPEDGSVQVKTTTMTASVDADTVVVSQTTDVVDYGAVTKEPEAVHDNEVTTHAEVLHDGDVITEEHHQQQDQELNPSVQLVCANPLTKFVEQWPPASPSERVDARLAQKGFFTTKNQDPGAWIGGEKPADSDELKAVDIVKARYEPGSQPQEVNNPKIMREPKKLEHTWGKSIDDEEAASQKSTLPREQDLVPLTTLGIEHTKQQYQNKVQSQNSQESHLPPVVNREKVEKVAPPEITQNLKNLFESGNLPDRHEIKKQQVEIKASADGGVYENEPQYRDGVVRESDPNMADEILVQGPAVKASELKSQWEMKKDEQTSVRKKKIIVAEGEVVCLENEPVRRDDISRESDTDRLKDLPQAGHSDLLKKQLSESGKKEIKRREIKLVEDDDNAQAVVIENEPVRRDDVVHADDATEEIQFTAGKAKNLAGYFLTQTGEVKVEKKPIVIERGPQEPAFLENEPTQRRDDVVHGDDEDEKIQITAGKTKNLAGFFVQQTGEVKVERKPIVIERASQQTDVTESEPTRRDDVVHGDDISADDLKIQEELREGRTRNMASLWQNRQEETPTKPKAPIKLDIASEPIVLENNPIERDDVVKCDSVIEEVMPRSRGRIQGIAGRFATKEVDIPKGRKEMIKIEFGQEATIIENEPVQRDDVVKCEDAGAGEVIRVKRGKAKNMANIFRAKQEEEESGAMRSQDARPQWMVEFEASKGESGVYENEPVLRDDVVRSDAFDQPEECIQISQSRNLRSMWADRETSLEKEKALTSNVPEVIKQRYRDKQKMKEAEEEAARRAAEEEERLRREEEERLRLEEEERKRLEEEKAKAQAAKQKKLLSRFPQGQRGGGKPPSKRSLFF